MQILRAQGSIRSDPSCQQLNLELLTFAMVVPPCTLYAQTSSMVFAPFKRSLDVYRIGCGALPGEHPARVMGTTASARSQLRPGPKIASQPELGWQEPPLLATE